MPYTTNMRQVNPRLACTIPVKRLSSWPSFTNGEFITVAKVKGQLRSATIQGALPDLVLGSCAWREASWIAATQGALACSLR